jgi:hypothetical protein
MQALSEGWLKYEIVSQVMPTEELRYGVSNFRTYTGYLDVWIVDYIKAARELQLGLYGQTNIEINPLTHISAIDLARGSAASSDNYYEDDDETTTEDYEPHYYTEEVSTTRKSIFNNNWLNRVERTTSENQSTSFDWNYYPEETTEDNGYYSEEETTIEAWVGFEAAARSNRISGGIGPQGKWENKGRLFVNENEIFPSQSWNEPEKYAFHFNTWAKPEEEFPYTDEQFYWMREPVKINLKKGNNEVKLYIPKTFKGQRWSFAFIKL